jgi:hypothetical protein
MRRVIALAALATAGCGGAHQTPSPPVTPTALRQAITRSGLQIRWRDGRAGGDVVADLAGEVRDERGRGRIAFEIAVTRGDADIHVLGRARYPLRYDPASGSPLVLHMLIKREIDPDPRGVIANVAYATWWFTDPDDSAAARVSARLDAAVLSAFPPDDAAAHPVLTAPVTSSIRSRNPSRAREALNGCASSGATRDRGRLCPDCGKAYLSRAVESVPPRCRG